MLYGIVHESGVNNEISEKLKEDFEKMKASEVEELTEAFKAVKTQMATELEANVEIKGKLESDLTSTKHSLLDVKHQLNMAEKVCTLRIAFKLHLIILNIIL